MSYQITLSIDEDSLEAQNIESVVETEHITREEAALRLLATPQKANKATPGARRILGMFSSPEDRALMDEVMELVMSERERHNAELPRV